MGYLQQCRGSAVLFCPWLKLVYLLPACSHHAYMRIADSELQCMQYQACLKDKQAGRLRLWLALQLSGLICSF